MATRLSAVPERINAGSSVEMTLGWSDYPADDGWTLALIFNGPTANFLSKSGSANGKSFDVTLSATDTGTLGTGAPTQGIALRWFARVTKSGVVKDADEGTITVDPNPATAGAYESQAQTELDAVNGVISGRITSDMAAWQIYSRAATREKLTDLFQLRTLLEARVEAEKSGGAFGPTVLYGFVSPSS